MKFSNIGAKYCSVWLFVLAAVTGQAACTGSFSIQFNPGQAFNLTNSTIEDMKFNVISRGNYPLGTLQTRDPLFYVSTDDIFCPRASIDSKDSTVASLQRIYFVESVGNCSQLPTPSYTNDWGNPNMTFVVVKAPQGQIEKISDILESKYDWELLTYSKRFNVGFIVLDEASFDTLKKASTQENGSFKTILDFRVV